MAAPAGIDPKAGIWTGLLKWSLAQHNVEPVTDAKPMSDEDKEFLRNVFDTLVVDEVKRMKIIVEVLRMPEDEAGIKRLLQTSANALEKLHEVPTGRSEAEHYGGAPKPAAAVAANTLAPPGAAGAAASASSPGRSPSPARNSSSRSASPLPVPSPSRSPSSTPVPTVLDYRTASIPALMHEMQLRKEGALEELDDRCLTSDNANDFFTVGGLEPLLICLLSSYEGIRWRAAQALSTMVQNNPKAQERAFNHRALEYLLPLLAPPAAVGGAAAAAASASADAGASSSSEGWTVVVKALTALSALIRSDDLPAIREAFLAQGGVERLAALLTLPPPGPPVRVQTKLFLLLKHIFSWFPATKIAAVRLGVLAALCGHLAPRPGTAAGGLSADHDINHREALLRVLLEFARASGDNAAQAAAKEIRQKGFGLKDALAARIKALKALKLPEDREQAEEELSLATQLSKACKF